MTRAFFLFAAAYDGAWLVVLLVCPAWVLVRPPPSIVPVAGLLLLVTAACLANAVRVRRQLVLFTILAKLAGPPAFIVAVSMGCLTWSQGWMPIVNDLLWIPPLAFIWKRAGAR